jgi:hypothetical protein
LVTAHSFAEMTRGDACTSPSSLIILSRRNTRWCSSRGNDLCGHEMSVLRCSRCGRSTLEADPVWIELLAVRSATTSPHPHVRVRAELGNVSLKTTLKALREISLCPWRVGTITAAALVLLHREHHRANARPDRCRHRPLTGRERLPAPPPGWVRTAAWAPRMVPALPGRSSTCLLSPAALGCARAGRP